MKSRKANKNDFENIKDFYYDVMINTPNIVELAKWIPNRHPTVNDLKEHFDSENFYILERDGKIAGAFVLSMEQGEEYHDQPWKIEVKDNEACVIHLLCVRPEFKGQNIGSILVDDALELAKKSKKKVCRLETMTPNLPAMKLYESKGFEQRGKVHWFKEDAEWLDFYLYEYIL